ncbi:MAG TPA: enoyl-CoA hydratase, partial [Alcanivorax sp.]|nr:enoyl-CoA hydratase [Alcanivorax sp.]
TPLKMLLAFTKFGVKKTNLFQQACWAWRELPVPVIAVLHGYCYGGGLQLALAADFRIA